MHFLVVNAHHFSVLARFVHIFGIIDPVEFCVELEHYDGHGMLKLETGVSGGFCLQYPRFTRQGQ